MLAILFWIALQAWCIAWIAAPLWLLDAIGLPDDLLGTAVKFVAGFGGLAVSLWLVGAADRWISHRRHS